MSAQALYGSVVSMGLHAGCLLAVLILGAGQLGAGAQDQAHSATTQQTPEAWLTSGPFVMLRGMWSGNQLDFDAQGNLIGQADTLPFGLSAMVVQQVSLSDTALTISGTRAGLDFEDMPKKKGQLGLTVQPINKKENPKVIVTIARDSSHPEALHAALLRVFSVGIDDQLTQRAPDYWHNWLIDHIHPELKMAEKAVDRPAQPPAGIPLHPGKVTPPYLAYSPSPKFTAAAKAAHFSGVCVVGLIVDASGAPQDVHIVRPIGMGLDEMAVSNVSQYRFKPAAYEGKPVPVEINIEVNFRIY